VKLRMRAAVVPAYQLVTRSSACMNANACATILKIKVSTILVLDAAKAHADVSILRPS
jgi:hypothetical protein